MAEEQKTTIEQQLEELKKLVDEYLNGWKRAKADYMNLERQMEKEKAQWMNMAVLPVALELITLVEHLDQAFLHIPNGEHSEEIKIWIQGIAHTRDDLKQLLTTLQIEKIVTAGKAIDLNFMEVVAKEKTESQEPGVVIREVGAGYTMAGQVIKVAKVIVSE